MVAVLARQASPSFDVEGDSLAHQLGLADGRPRPRRPSMPRVSPSTACSAARPPPGTGLRWSRWSGSRRPGRPQCWPWPDACDSTRARPHRRTGSCPRQAAKVRRRAGFVGSASAMPVPRSATCSVERPCVVFVDAADTLTEATDQHRPHPPARRGPGGRGFAVVLGVTDTRPLAGLGFDQVVPIRRAGPTNPTSPAPAPVRRRCRLHTRPRGAAGIGHDADRTRQLTTPSTGGR